MVFILAVVLLWTVAHGYAGLSGDAQIYAFQALAKIKPGLSGDLYLQNTSQDQFTIFSSLYASCIDRMGVEDAARSLTLFFLVWLTAAAWAVAATLTDKKMAWLCIAGLVMSSADYGGSGVFHFTETYLTARLPAEALILTAIAMHLNRRGAWALPVAAVAMLIHPLMALPGLLVLLALRLELRYAIGCAIAILLIEFGLSISARTLPSISREFIIMDDEWLDVVRERSQFLFLRLWSYKDWDANIRPFVLLIFASIALKNPSIRKLSAAAMLIGATGLVVAFVAGSTYPVALLIQGQAWRWVWIAFMLSALLLPPALFRVWRDDHCGPLCVSLLVGSWLIPYPMGTAGALLALVCWSLRDSVGERLRLLYRWGALALGLAVLAWATRVTWQTLHSSLPDHADNTFVLTRYGNALGAKLVIAGVVTWIWYRLQTLRTAWTAGVSSVLLLSISMLILPKSLHAARTLLPQPAVDVHEWSRYIPATDTVLITPAHDVGGFVWFNLERPNYLALDQSSGVVFSRETSLEIRRRSEVLSQLMTPNWTIFSNMHRTPAKAASAASHPLTAALLRTICTDPKLGFVISPENVGVQARALSGNIWSTNWNLYDCGQNRL